jgi:hypothetical protein
MTTEEATNGKSLQLALLAGLTGAAVGVICIFFLPAAQIILGICAVALVIAVLFFWNSVRTLGGDTDIPDLPPNMAEQGGALEAKVLRKKMLLLSLKDLENEKKLGKISDDDYEDVAQRYRDEVKALMREMDGAAAPFRSKAEELLRAHLASKGLGAAGDGAKKASKNDDSKGDLDEEAKADEAAKTIVDEPRTQKLGEPGDEPEIPTKKSRDHDSSKGVAARAKCSKCGESNEPDAKFCKACATPMAAKQEAGKDTIKDEPKSESKEEGGADA